MSAAAAAPSTSTADESKFRLPLDVRPTHYDVTVRTDLEKLVFDGFVQVSLDVKSETSEIVFNSAALTLGEASVYSDALKTEQKETGRSFDSVQERTALTFATPLPAGSKATLRVAFAGELTGSMTGYYRSAYDVDGKTEHYTLTQFEPTAARRAFPCWDEPLLKATFAITMISRANLVNLSNMPVASEKPYDSSGAPAGAGDSVAGLAEWLSSLAFGESNNKWKVTKFETTPPMSTYLVAWANGPFEYIESSYTSPLSGKTRPLRVYATADLIPQAQFGLDVKAKVLPLYEKVFDVEYPLPKLDTLIATDFDAGAMENWGLITGRTSAYCLDPKRSDIAAQKRVATVQSHEVAHQWFGNITTMEWWDNLYLNEGFATLMGEVVIADKVFPEWKVNTTFIFDHLNDALDLDAKLSSHPIEVACPDANQINQIFDALSYSKAASVLRMLSNYVGEDKFLAGVSVYLKKRLYANSVSKDLWEGIAEATGNPAVVPMMQTWVGKMGYPVLTVTEVEGGIKVRQDRFLETGLAKPEDNETIWTVPLSLLTVKDGRPVTDKTLVLDEREKFFPLDTAAPYKLNAGTVGVYRVLYSGERLTKIAEEMAKGEKVFSVDDRMGLVLDIAALSQAGYVKVSDALTALYALRNETEYVVWRTISIALGSFVSTWYEHPEIYEGLKALRRALYGPLVKKLGYEYSEDESPSTKELRTEAIGALLASKDLSVAKELQRRFAEWQKTGDDSHIPADLVRLTYHAAVKFGGRAEYDTMKKLHENPANPSQRQAAILALGASEEKELAWETLSYSAEKSRDQDLMIFFRGVGNNAVTHRVLPKYFKENYDVLYKRFEGNFSLKYLLESAFSGLTTEKDADETEAFFVGKDTGKYKLSLQQTLDSIRAKAAWAKRSTGDISQWLEEWQKESKL